MWAIIRYIGKKSDVIIVSTLSEEHARLPAFVYLQGSRIDSSKHLSTYTCLERAGEWQRSFYISPAVVSRIGVMIS